VFGVGEAAGFVEEVFDPGAADFGCIAFGGTGRPCQGSRVLVGRDADAADRRGDQPAFPEQVLYEGLAVKRLLDVVLDRRARSP
jgi:hypothetical protein